MIIVMETKGIEQLVSLMGRVDPAYVREKTCELIYLELVRFAEMIRADPNIPKEVKDALFIYMNVSSGRVGIGLFIEGKARWLRFGVIQYEQYKCPVRKYWGGKLAPSYTLENYLLEKWNQHKAQILDNIKRGIVSIIRGDQDGS